MNAPSIEWPFPGLAPGALSEKYGSLHNGEANMQVLSFRNLMDFHLIQDSWLCQGKAIMSLKITSATKL